MSDTIPLLHDLPVITEDSHKLFLFHDFTAFLSAKRSSRDSIIKTSNIFGWLNGKAKPVKIVDEKPAFEVNHALHFMFAHSEKFEICKKVVNQIQAKVFSSNDATYSSMKELYDDVTKLNLLTDLFEQECIVETNVHTIDSSYKHEYDCEAWNKICLFELQFSQSFPIEVTTESHESLMNKRAEYLGSLKSSLSLAQCLKRDSRHQIERRSQRKDLDDNGIAVSLCCNDCPIVLEKTLHTSLPNDELITQVVSVDCTKACLHSRALHLYVETATQDEKSLDEVSSILRGCLKKLHQEECAEIFFFAEDSFDKFRDRDGEIMRFELRDQVISEKMDQHIVKHWRTLDQEHSEECVQNSSVERCCICYAQVLLTPLSTETFDILTEWYIETPLIFQILLTTFINPSSMQRTENKKGFLKAKLFRLYQQYDARLNVYNRKYIGFCARQKHTITLHGLSKHVFCFQYHISK